jgi:PTH1 family peptidyl-tRNA hydrolase
LAVVVVGLGNPGVEYRDTRHNVGQRVVDQIARQLKKSWRRSDGAWTLARATWRGEPLVLMKPHAFMNVSGPVVARALRALHAGPSDTILVYDDIDLPLGTVRLRMKGSHGGHNGVRSVLDSLGTQEVRRVKLGVGRPATKHGVADHVLDPFERDELPVVEEAVAEAVEKILSLA